MAPRKKNLKKRETFKVPYAVLYKHDTAEGKPKKSSPEIPPGDVPEDTPPVSAQSKPVPSFAKKK